jgi:hypothetical protein
VDNRAQAEIAMKKMPCLFFVLGLLTLGIRSVQAADANQPAGFRLTVELQDGSRLVGKAGDETYQFRSDVLGEMKLPLEKIRAIECQPKTNSVKLTTASGDSLSAQFAMKEIRIETAFGNVKLPANLLKRMQVSAATVKMAKIRPGLIALWRGEGNGNDSVGGNNGVLTDVSFADGKVGQAFSFTGSNQDVHIPNNASLNMGSGNGFTLTAWINPSSISHLNPIFEWNSGDSITAPGAHFYIFPDGSLYANFTDADGGWHRIQSSAGLVTTETFQHVAVTYEKASGQATLYYNGVMVARQRMENLAPMTAYDLHLGRRPPTQGETYNFEGLLDEAAIYNRALSEEEIKAICTEENNGDPLPTPKPAPFQQSIRSFDGFNRGGLP